LTRRSQQSPTVRAVISDGARAKGLSLAIDTAGALQNLRGDVRRLGQALINDLGNAVRFTEHDSITLRCRRVSHSDTEHELRFDVGDTGVGSPPAAQGRLFSPFQQVDDSHARTYGNTGLGLVITKRIAELMGGEVGVDSTPGVGSTFWLTVRLAKGDATRRRGRLQPQGRRRRQSLDAREWPVPVLRGNARINRSSCGVHQAASTRLTESRRLPQHLPGSGDRFSIFGRICLSSFIREPARRNTLNSLQRAS
jgi:hypothetical protein